MITDAKFPGSLEFGQRISNRHYFLEASWSGWIAVGYKVMGLSCDMCPWGFSQNVPGCVCGVPLSPKLCGMIL